VNSVDSLPDIQACEPDYPLNLTRVGVTGVKKLVKVERGNDERPVVLISNFEVFVDLPSDRKGANLSRNFEAIDEVLEEAINRPVYEIEELCGEIAKRLLLRHEYATRAEVKMKSEYIVRRQTPVTKANGQEVVDIFAEAVAKSGDTMFSGVEGMSRFLGRAYRFVSGLQGLDRRRVAERQRTLANLRKAQAALDVRRSQASLAREAVARTRDGAASAVAAHEDLISRIDARRDLAAQFVGELDAARRRLQRTIDDAAAGRPAEPGLAVGLPLRPFKGDLDWPVTGTVRGGFGRQVNRKFHTSVVSNGVQIAADVSTPVLAVHDGLVAYATAFTGFGNLVILDHGSVAFSLYGYLADIDVVSGERVSQGQRLGSVGTALDGEPSLYFELRIDGKPVDPLQWLRRK